MLQLPSAAPAGAVEKESVGWVSVESEKKLSWNVGEADGNLYMTPSSGTENR